METDEIHDDVVERALEGLDMNGLLARAVKGSVERNAGRIARERVDEAYVANPKPYDQITEFVSQPTKDWHKELYGAYVTSLNRVSIEIDAADKEGANSRSSRYRSLKIDESHLLNAVWLHELFFANCFDPHSMLYMDSPSYLKLEKQWGTFDQWQQHFIACALACREGFAVLGFNMFLQQYVNTIVEGHSQNVMLGLFPILVIDMHEHSRADFKLDSQSYLVAMMREINWTVCDERIKRAETIMGALR